MNNFFSIKKNCEFQTVYKKGKSYANKYLVMYVLPVTGSTYCRMGISVSRKVGNSVVRHRVKRLIRESFRLNADRMAAGFDIVVIARQDAAGKSYSQMESALLHLLKIHHLFRNDQIVAEQDAR